MVNVYTVEPVHPFGSSERLTPELQCIVDCLTSNPAFEPATLRGFDTERILYLLDCHRLTTIMYRQLQSLPNVPATMLSQLRERSVQNTCRQITFINELCRVVKLLQKSQIETISLKGPILGQLYYGSYAIRECKDIDILVRPANLQAAYRILTNNGYALSETLWSSPKQETVYRETFHHYNLYHQEHGIELELHWRLNTDTTDEAALWSNALVHWVGGVPVKTLAPVDTFMYLCEHGGMHQWKRLFWLLDIARIIDAEGPDFLANVYQSAGTKNRARYVLSASLLANKLLGVQLPNTLHEAIKCDTALNKLVPSYIFWINAVAESYGSPLKSIRAFCLSFGRFFNAYRAYFYVESYPGLYRSMRHFFINPAYWRTYSFSDRFFALNYVAAPFFWIHSLFRKHR